MKIIASREAKKCYCCGVADRKYRSYCGLCHNAYQREHRLEYKDFSAEQKRKAISRSIANVYQRRGKIIKRPCQVCKAEINVEKHHEDYDNPLIVKWLCRECHWQIHGMEKHNV